MNLSSTGSPRPVIPQDGNGYGMNMYNSLGGNDFYSRVNQTGKDDQSKQQTSKKQKFHHQPKFSYVRRFTVSVTCHPSCSLKMLNNVSI